MPAHEHRGAAVGAYVDLCERAVFTEAPTWVYRVVVLARCADCATVWAAGHQWFVSPRADMHNDVVMDALDLYDAGRLGSACDTPDHA